MGSQTCTRVALDSYIEDAGLDNVPSEVVDLAEFLDSQGLKVVIRKNSRDISGDSGCASAAEARDPFAHSADTMNLLHELKTIFIKASNRKGDVVYVMLHLRGNRKVSPASVKTILKANGVLNVRNIRFLNDEELNDLGGLEKGTINPFVEFKQGKASVCHIFDEDLMRSYDQQGHVTTNAFNHEWLLDFNIRDVIENMRERYGSKNIMTGAIAAGGPSEVLSKVHDYISQSLGVIVYGRDAVQLFQRLVDDAVGEILGELKEVDLKGEPTLSVPNAGTFTDCRRTTVSDPRLELAMNLDLNHPEVVDILRDLTRTAISSGAKLILLPCNILPFADDDIREAAEDAAEYFSIRDAVSEAVSDLEDSEVAVLLGGKAVSSEKWSIYGELENIHTLNNVEAANIDRAMMLVNIEDY